MATLTINPGAGAATIQTDDAALTRFYERYVNETQSGADGGILVCGAGQRRFIWIPVGTVLEFDYDGTTDGPSSATVL